MYFVACCSPTAASNSSASSPTSVGQALPVVLVVVAVPSGTIECLEVQGVNDELAQC